jgi:hypothetical protein
VRSICAETGIGIRGQSDRTASPFCSTYSGDSPIARAWSQIRVALDLSHRDDAEMAEAAELIAVYKQIRPVIQSGRLYRLASVLDAPFAASEYVADDGAQVVVLC